MHLTVAENIFLGRLPTKGPGFVSRSKMNAEAGKLIDDFGLDIKPSALVKDLSVAHQQMVEIIKAYSRSDLKIIAFDEPTASLCDTEIDTLFKIIGKLKKEGKIIIYVSHRMKEIHQIADRVAIFKDGRYIGTVDPAIASEHEMVRMMVGRDLGDVFSELPRNQNIGDVVLEVKNLSTDYVRNISFSLRKGEILGFAGLVGAGRTEVARGIIGADRLRGGEIFFEGKPVVCKSPKSAMKLGMVLVPEDRKTQGLLSNLDVGGNISVATLDENSRFGFVNQSKEDGVIEEGIRKFRVKTPDKRKMVLELSGGNQQKTIIARWMSTDPKMLILDEPTKGIDVGAKAEFYQLIASFASSGVSVILISSELPEVIGLSDRIIVMKSKRITGVVKRGEATEESILSLAMLDEGALAGQEGE
jgi:L-arabinose transport system ATP-binding protein